MLLLCVPAFLSSYSQERKVQNRPYTDLRPFHFGVVVGVNMQDLEFVNAGPQILTDDGGTTYESIVTCDQDRWDTGFNVGLLGEFRLHENFQLRLTPQMFFGARHLTFHNFTPRGSDASVDTEVQNLKTAYISAAADLIFSAPRFNNYRPYLVTGVNFMENLTSRDNDYLRLKPTDVFLQVGVGCDFYLPFFKLRPELKFMYGLTDCLDHDHAKDLRNLAMLRYTNSVSSCHSKIIALSFYFE